MRATQRRFRFLLTLAVGIVLVPAVVCNASAPVGGWMSDPPAGGGVVPGTVSGLDTWPQFADDRFLVPEGYVVPEGSGLQSSVSQLPEPASLALLVIGALGLAGLARRRRGG